MTDHTPAPETGDQDASILIIDDDPIVVQLLAKSLRTMGKVVFATNGLDGLEVAARHRPRVMLIDADLPDITGFDIVRRVRLDRELHDSTLIMISAHSAAVVSEGAESAGADGFLSKPINEAELHHIVRRALSKPRAAPVAEPMTPDSGFGMELVDSLEEDLRKADLKPMLTQGATDAIRSELGAFVDRVRGDVARLRAEPELADSAVLQQLGGIDQLCAKISQAIGRTG